MSERDAQVFASIGGDPDTLEREVEESKQNGSETVEVEEDVLEDLQQQVRSLTRRVSTLESERDGPQYRDSMLTVQKHRTMIEEGVGDSLSASERRAVVIYQNWQELAQPLPNGCYGVSTKRNSKKKGQPCQFKLDLQARLETDLQWVQVYRAMKTLAKNTGGEVGQDEYDREYVRGGVFTYETRATPDGSNLYRILYQGEQ